MRYYGKLGKLGIKTFVRDSFIISNGKLRRVLKRSSGRRVIAFHEIKCRERFREKLQWLKERFKILSLGELLERNRAKSPSLAITFDDGYSSWYEIAAPVLEELSIPAVFFISSGFVGLEGNRAHQFLRHSFLRTSILKPLTEAQVVDLSRHPLFEIASHTANHINLGKTCSEEKLKSEIEGDIDRLQAWTGKKVRWLAYPFGGKEHLCFRSKEHVKGTQIDAAFTIVPGFITPETDRYAIGRDSLDENSSLKLWEGWLSGGYDIKGRL